MIKSWQALLIYFLIMLVGYVWASFYDAPYLALASNITIGVGAYFGKRIIQRKIENGKVPPTD